jgi:heparan-alpha-glucosaminide N-acetyltransferase
MSNQQLAPNQTTSSSVVQRLASIDIFRGMVMFLMMAEVLELNKLAAAYPDSSFFAWLKHHTSHVDWVGCSLHDLIQPGFTFLVGVSLPFSLATRLRKGAGYGSMFLHAVWRALLLVVLGIALRSLGKPTTDFRFDDTLTQIGLGYLLLFLIALTPRWNQVLSAMLILVGYWLLFAMWPLPAADFNYEAVGVPKDWPHLMSGFEAHWNKNSHPAWAFDVWFLHLFPYSSVYPFHPGGYATLSFIPTLATMTMGLLAGGMLAGGTLAGGTLAGGTLAGGRVSQWGSIPAASGQRSYGMRIFLLATVGVCSIAAGWSLDHFGVCPNVKRIWTPSFTLFSGGICFVWLAVLHGICEGWNQRAWGFPFMIFGSNSILAYGMSWVLEKPLKELLIRHFGKSPFTPFGEAWEHVLLGSTVLLFMWLILLWLYRKRVFVRI